MIERRRIEPGEAGRGRGGCVTQQTSPFCNLVHFSAPLAARHTNLDREDSDHWGAGMWLADFCPTAVRMFSTICTTNLTETPRSLA